MAVRVMLSHTVALEEMLAAAMVMRMVFAAAIAAR